MDDGIQQRVIEALRSCGADEVRTATRWLATFGPRTVEVTLYDFGPLFQRRYQASATDEAGLTVTGEPSYTVAGAIGGLAWGDLLLE